MWCTGLSFNSVTNAHAIDAINLRHGYATNLVIDYTLPEWEAPANQAAAPTRNEPACWIGGTWPEILTRFEIQPSDITNACEGATTETNALAELTQFLFSGHGLVYDIEWGGSLYLKRIPGTSTDRYFSLTGYMGKTLGNKVNCYDQASGLSLCGNAIGIPSEIRYMDPFGYILETSLVGRGNSNNPFYGNRRYGFDPLPVCPTNSPSRSGFGNHMFVMLGANVYDSCAGPVRGEWTFDDYRLHVIDTMTTNTLYSTGTNSVPYSSIKEVH
jgi:hypothetical protein